MNLRQQQAMAREVVPSILRGRETCKKWIDEAVAASDQKTARSLTNQLQKLDKLIADYELGRYAPRN